MPRRPILRPGSALLRRDSAHLQVGPVVVDDGPEVVALLRRLDGTIAGDQPLLDRLESVGAVIDTSEWPGGLPRAELSHAALTGIDPRSLAGRRTLRVGFADGCADLTEPLADLLRRSGVRAGAEPTFVVIATVGEPAREAVDALMRSGVPHLPVAVDGTVVRVGPFVIPEHTPCLRCFDQTRAEWDSAWPALANQFGRTRITDRAVNALGIHAAVGFIAGEVLAFAEGRPPETLGKRVTLDNGRMHAEPARFALDCACHLSIS